MEKLVRIAQKKFILFLLGIFLFCCIVVGSLALPGFSNISTGSDSISGTGTKNELLPDSCPVGNITQFILGEKFNGLTGGSCYFTMNAPVSYTSTCNERFCNERMLVGMECSFRNWDWQHPESPSNRGLYFSTYEFRDADTDARVLPDTRSALIPMFYPPPNATEIVSRDIRMMSYQGVHDYCSPGSACKRGQHIPVYTETVVWQQGKYVFHIIYNTVGS